MSRKIWKEAAEWVVWLLIAVAVAFVINKFVIYTVSPPTPSMENTILVDDRVITFRLAYLFSEPKRGDIVVFVSPDMPDEDFMKRVIGLPGETVEVIDGVVYINDEPIEEDYLKEPMTGSYGPFQVPEESYFMMGDNRNISWDSRFWDNKYVAEDKIKGKVLFEFFRKFKWLA